MAQDLVRLQKYCSEQGLLSRREAEAYIQKGWITVNGKPAVLGQKIDPSHDKVKILGPNKKHTYLKYYKPRGIVTNCPQPGEQQISDIIDKKYRHLSAIGRLDKDSEGLILLTNDGLFSKQFLDPNQPHEREYFVQVTPAYPHHMLVAFQKGVVILGQQTKPAKTRQATASDIKAHGIAGRRSSRAFFITLTEGKNRQIRRMVAKFGCRVLVLKRIRIEQVFLHDLGPNQAAPISNDVLGKP